MTDDEKMDVVRAMVAAWDRQDWAAVVDLFAPEGVLHSVMSTPLVGRAAIAERLAVLAEGLTSLELRVRAMGVVDGRVFVERRDVFDRAGVHGEVPVVGVLAVGPEGVTEWLEYYDRATLLAGMGMTQDFAE
ncbi:nuclear transport factor 2 family protein [Klenkia brasiliensis]|uniref:SnoaL-like domain-containing protein n=1 Tax=Klenkia brasiliensis TaxID=333142 RepID=A0A1G8A3J6_9ACTN|nr:nuclear transport factor 2 family protein [Klenkia brasiliensis]SDH15488.1 SnoaL-like domain-containing protein [Klenkia brasiliensis]